MKSYLIYILAILPACLFAQNDTQAQELLMKAEKSIMEGGVIHASFEGDLQGEIILKGEKFHLNSNGIQSWYDGKTQWSYSEDTQEVNISTPTPEEIQSINPYSLMQTYKNGYKCRYMGESLLSATSTFQVMLLPEKKGDIESITLYLTKDYLPKAIRVKPNGQAETEIIINSCRLHQPNDESIFTFNKRDFPDADIIDMR